MDQRFIDAATTDADIRGVNYTWPQGKVAVTVDNLESPRGWIVWDMDTLRPAFPGRLFADADTAAEAAVSFREGCLTKSILTVNTKITALASRVVAVASFVAVPRTVARNVLRRLLAE